MTERPEIGYLSWGDGPPVIALHGLGLESSSFTGLAAGVVERGFRMIAADLPGFGTTPIPDGPLTPAVLAEPVLEFASRFDTKPLVMGMSLGGRVALECALTQPDLFRGGVFLAPPLPRRHRRYLLTVMHLLQPGIAERLPVDCLWPLMKKMADKMEDGLNGDEQHDWFLRTSKRSIYYFSCPATRRAFVSATKELMLEPAFGPDGLWTRLESLAMPSAFVWGEHDRLVPARYVDEVQDAAPQAFQLHVGCAGHFSNGPHFRCMEAAALEAIDLVEGEVARGRRTRKRRRRPMGCLVDDGSSGSRPDAPERHLTAV
jgi:pimeloyl-ACP methyl ester carboxylesterase